MQLLIEGIGIILLAANSVLLAVLLARKPAHHKPEAAAAATGAPEISAAERTKLEQLAEQAFQAAVETSTAKFGSDLDETSKRLNQLIMRITTEVVERELEQYRQSLAAARTAALESLSNMQSAIEQRQSDLEHDVDAELAKRRAVLEEKVERKLGEAVAAYIVDSLGQGADLGAQRAFLLENLERHKAELKTSLHEDV